MAENLLAKLEQIEARESGGGLAAVDTAS
jgi:hypothetical protein